MNRDVLLIGVICTITAFGLGVGVGWMMRGSGEKQEIAAGEPRKPPPKSTSSSSMSAAPTTLPPTPPTPPTVAKKTKPLDHEPDCEPMVDPEVFDWPTTTPTKGLVAVDDTHHLLTHEFIVHIIESVPELMKSARIVPAYADGKPAGVRILSVKPPSVLYDLGLRNGDRLESLNGCRLSDPAAALEMYGRLKTSSDFLLKIVRAGVPMTLHYHVVGAPPVLAPPPLAVPVKPSGTEPTF